MAMLGARLYLRTISAIGAAFSEKRGPPCWTWDDRQSIINQLELRVLHRRPPG